jgi:hypothetical protein
MNSKKRDFIPLFNVFQTEHPLLAGVILVIAIILVARYPIFLLPILITAVVIGIIGLFAIIAGLVAMNREALEYRVVKGKELTSGGIPGNHTQPAFTDESHACEGDQ